jgi:tetratricopeptide (TPR) repeat protein
LSRFVRVVFALTLLTAQAHAAEDALSLYRSGKYERAIAVASSGNTASGYALAARAALAEAMVRTPCLSCLKRAEEFARKSIAADPKLAEGHIYLALSLGYRARIVGVIRARLGGYAEEAKKHLDAALASDPGNAWALAALGGWNIEIARNGGATLAKWLYGATVASGLDDFSAAFKAAPDNLVLRYQYALSLGGLDLESYRDKVRDALALASGVPPETAYERFAQVRARELLAALNRNDRAAFDKLVRRDQGYP